MEITAHPPNFYPIEHIRSLIKDKFYEWYPDPTKSFVDKVKINKKVTREPITYS